MPTALARDPALVAYAATVVVVSLHMILLDAYSGVVRTRSKTAVNPEDAAAFAPGIAVVDADPPVVARVMRAHRNLVANALPFLLLGLVWVSLGATFTWAAALFGVFVVARLAHSIAYVRGAQPWRTVFFLLGQLALVGVVVQIVRALAAA